MTEVAVIDMRELSVTPFFKYEEVLNEPKSHATGTEVLEMKELVEVRIAGQKHYAPVFPVDAMWKREGMRVITFAERWPDQYAAFKKGNPQEAIGTPLEMLRQYGVTPETISFCRALKIYSIEALASCEGASVKAMGMRANALKEAASKFLAERAGTAETMALNAGLNDRVAELEAELARLRSAGSQTIPAEQAAPEEIDAWAGMTDSELKDAIEQKVGARPKGNPSRQTLIGMIEGM